MTPHVAATPASSSAAVFPHVDGAQTKTLTLRQIDARYEQLGCLGQGGFASVFLARKRTPPHRLVAIKVLPLDKSDADARESFSRELDAVVSLNTRDDGTDENEERDQNIIFFREWFQSSDAGSSPSSAFIVMNYVEGGTLAEHIDSRRKNGSDPYPFAERRIAWYILQLCDALSYAHERNVSHHDVKSENIIIDSRRGGNLVLTDFGTSVRPGQDKIGFTYAYASTELLTAHRGGEEDLSRINPLKVDAFGLGCVAFELLVCRRLLDVRALEGTTLADLVAAGRLEATFEQMSGQSPYSDVLQHIVKRLLDPSPETRAAPSDYPRSFREDPKSPLLCPSLRATHGPGCDPDVLDGHLTMDNICLGTFVRRGPDWDDGDADGGEGSIDVVTKLDSDALYTKVTWPSRFEDDYRIGAGCKMELTMAPTPLPGGASNGFLESRDPLKYRAGMTFECSNPGFNGMIVAHVAANGILLVPPPSFRMLHDHKAVPRIPCPPEGAPPVLGAVSPRDPELSPESWDLSRGELCDVTNDEEQRDVLGRFHAASGGVPRSEYTVLSLQRVQSVRLWDAYARRREVVAQENWGCPNEQLLFHGTSRTPPETIMRDAVGFDPRFSDQGAFGRGSYFAANAEYSNRFKHERSDGLFQMFLARVTLGRVQEPTGKYVNSTRRPDPGFHSVKGLSQLQNGVASHVHVIYETSTQALPEYLITYTDKTLEQINRGPRRILTARRPHGMMGK